MSSNPPIEALYVTDTNALIWRLINDKKLGSRAAAKISAAERGETLIVISSITLAELYYANTKHSWFTDFEEVF